MAFYDYKFVDEDGCLHVVERSFKMGEAPEQIRVAVGEASYLALRVFNAPMLQRTALSEWATDLPPLKSPPLDTPSA
jgi:hypothetical protein